jgi:hypothetical protein
MEHFYRKKGFTKPDIKEYFEPLKTTREIQDGVKIQNGAKNPKKLIISAKWPIFNRFQKPLLRFVRTNSVYKTPLR